MDSSSEKLKDDDAKVICPHCHYEWVARKPEPKKCPLCGKWLDKEVWTPGWTCPDCGKEYVETPVMCSCQDDKEGDASGP